MDIEIRLGFWLALLAALAAWCAMQVVVMLLAWLPGQWMDRLLDLGVLPKDSPWRDTLADFRRWMSWTEPSAAGRSLEAASASPLRERRDPADDASHRPLAVGEVSRVVLLRREGRQVLAKFPRTPVCETLLRKEQRILERLGRGSAAGFYAAYLPRPLRLADGEIPACTLFEYDPSRVDGEAILRRFGAGLDGRHLAWMFNRMLEVLGWAHHCGVVHGAVLPCHLLFDPPSHGMQLLGWTQAVELGQPLAAAPRRYRAWYPPECSARRGVGPATDIFLAAQTVVRLGGGDPRDARPLAHLPQPLRDALQRCRAARPQSRPQDAWALHEQWRDLLAGVYGSPRFVPLSIS